MMVRVALYIGAGCGGIVAAIAAWTVIASRLFVWMGGLSAFFPSPWTTWWRYLQHPVLSGPTQAFLLASGILAALPIIALGIFLFRMLWGRRKITPPRGGGMHPIEPGVTDNFGRATILGDKEALRRFPGPNGVVIGQMRSDTTGTQPMIIDPCTSGSGNFAMIAGTRSGKTMSAVTQLIYWPGSAVVLDPSMEMAPMLRSVLEAQGKRVLVLNPKLPGTGFNALDWLDPTRPLAGMDVQQVINWAFPDDALTDKAKDPYFEPTGKSLCAALLADLVWSDGPAEKSLREFRKRVITPEDKIKQALKHIAANSRSAFARDLASTLMKVTAKQWSGVYGQATQATVWLSEPELGGLVSGASFNSSDIMDGNTVIFVQIPLRTLEQSAGVGRVIVGALMNRLYASEVPNDRVLFLLDEAKSLGKLAIIGSALVDGAKCGIQLGFFYQDVGQIHKIWGGDDGIRTFYNNLEWRGYAAVKDEKTLEEVSKAFGERSVLSWSEGENAGVQKPPGLGWGSRSSGKTTNVSELKRRLYLPQEIQSANPRDLFVVAGQNNMHLTMPRYFDRPDLVQVVSPSPNYQSRREPAVAPPAFDLIPAHPHSLP
jgi:type IV secretion system protein VirD4